MKKKQIAVVMGIVLSAAALGNVSASAAENAAEQSAEAQTDILEEQDTIYGEVVSVSESQVTIRTGTRKATEPGGMDAEGQPGKDSEAVPEGQPGKDSEAAPEGQPGNDGEAVSEERAENGDEADVQEAAAPEEQPEQEGAMSLLELTGEEQEIEITEDTVITKQSVGRPGDGQNGAFGGGGATPELPSGEGGAAPELPSDEGGEAPEKPSGEAPEEPSGEEGEAPDLPSGERMQGEGGAPDMQQTETATWEDISEGDTIAVTLDENQAAATITILSAGMGGGMGQPGGGQAGQPESYDALTEYTEDAETSGESYISTGTDENAVRVYNDAVVKLEDADVSRDSDESTGGDNSSFYGVGAAVLASSGTVYVDDSTIVTDAAGGAGVFAYGTGTAYVSGTTIVTDKDTSGGIHAAGGGTLYAWDLTVQTSGESSAAIRSDRGGGTMVVDGGSYTSGGSGSPAIYSTADIAVKDADLTANGSEAICIEGLNSIHLYDSDLTGNMSDDERNDCTWNVILYQSMSGDSEVGNSTFEMQGGTLTAKNGGMFYTTNTESTFTLSNVAITYADDSEFFLKCTGNANQRGWGTSGANGADCLFTAISQEMEGDVIWDSISTLDLYLTEGSVLTGAIVDDETNAGNGGSGYCNVYISEDSAWFVTGDSTVSSLECAGTIVDEDGNTVTILGSDGTVYVEGTSSYTITTDSYEDSADLSGASQTTAWTLYEVERPAE